LGVKGSWGPNTSGYLGGGTNFSGGLKKEFLTFGGFGVGVFFTPFFFTERSFNKGCEFWEDFPQGPGDNTVETGVGCFLPKGGGKNGL